MGRPPEMVWHGDSTLPALDLIVLPGGFAYGDYLRAGALAAHAPVMREVAARARAGTPVLAICNGFQIAAEAGLLPGALLPNANRKFVCRDVYLRVENTASIFTAHYQWCQVVRMPIAHHEGNYYIDDDGLKEILDGDLVAFRYAMPSGEVCDEANPNGSTGNIAGVFNQSRTVLGLMPHPERLADTRLGGNDGNAMFEGLVAALS